MSVNVAIIAVCLVVIVACFSFIAGMWWASR